MAFLSWRISPGGIALASATPIDNDLPGRALTFEQRIDAQRSIERVYFAHQTGLRRSFEQAVTPELLERKVTTYLEQSLALETIWHTPVTADALEHEWRRIASSSRFPERLREISSALGGDGILLQECIARPALVERLSRSFFDHDQVIHAAARARIEQIAAALRAGRLAPEQEHPLRRVIELPAERIKEDPALSALRIGESSSIVERQGEFSLSVLLGESAHESRLAVYSSRKETWDTWWGDARKSLDAHAVATVARMFSAGSEAHAGDSQSTAARAFTPETAACFPLDTWQNGALDETPDLGLTAHSIWTGSVVLFFGTTRTGEPSGVRYDPSTDTFAPMSTIGAPPGAPGVSLWTGTEMIVYAGSWRRYNPTTDSWTGTSVPASAGGGVAVWTGSEMITQGSPGVRYNPSTDTSTPISSVNAPVARPGQSTVWDGNRMIVWGGQTSQQFNQYTNQGSRYDLATDTWTPTTTSGAPSARGWHVAVWTGSRMILWGGTGPGFSNLSNGYSYNPANDSWLPIDDEAPISGPDAVGFWTGSKIIVWGARYGSRGARYDPAQDAWEPINLSGAPAFGGTYCAQVWTGTRMIVWWGGFKTGGRYDPLNDQWTPIAPIGPPPAEKLVSEWTGNVMIVFDLSYQPYTGGWRYDPLLDAWSVSSTTGVPFGVDTGYTSVWTGDEMLIWGPTASACARYDPIGDAWSPISLQNAPIGRNGFSAVWTGSRMVVWGGASTTSPYPALTTGGRYDPLSDTWLPTSMIGAPSGRGGHKAVWTGSRMVIWGGAFGVNPTTYPKSGGRYDPIADSWTPTTSAGSPNGCEAHTIVWTGSRVVVWGGSRVDTGRTNTGGRYDPVGDHWDPTTLTNAPTARTGHTGVWTGSRMIVWGGGDGGGATNSGSLYEPVNDVWSSTSQVNAPRARYDHTAAWTGKEMIVWGGTGSIPGCCSVQYMDGSRYSAADADRDGIADSCDNCSSIPNHDQVDADGDLIGDVCDNCIDDSNPAQTDGDSDTFGDACDNCPSVPNPMQADADSDGAGNLCDNCPGSANSSQLDSDADGQGDACDCAPLDASAREPGEVHGLAVSRLGVSTAVLAWPAVPHADAYSVTRGDLATMTPTDYGPCLSEGMGTPEYQDSSAHAPGGGHFYLVQAENSACGLGPLGFTSGEQSRSNANPAACHGTLLIDRPSVDVPAGETGEGLVGRPHTRSSTP